MKFIDSVNHDLNAFLLGLFVKSESKLIGTIKVEPIDLVKESAWLGIMIGDLTSRGKGYGKESLSAVLDFLFCSLALKEVFLGVDLDNFVAISLYRKLGFSDFELEKNLNNENRESYLTVNNGAKGKTFNLSLKLSSLILSDIAPKTSK